MVNGLIMPCEVRTLLEWWLPRIGGILGKRVRSVVLFGGVALGDFQPGWSDVDICVVLDGPVSKDDASRIDRVHDEMRERFIVEALDGWRSEQAIEGPYIPFEMTLDPDAKAPCYAAWGSRSQWSEDSPVSPFDRYLLAHHGVRLSGLEVSFVAPTRESLARQLGQGLASATSAAEIGCRSPIWLAGMIHFLARSVVFWRDGVMLSKTAALEREMANRSPFTDAFGLALRMREAGSAACRHHLEELRKAFLAIAEPAAHLLKELVKG
jgi:hypothetical protein